MNRLVVYRNAFTGDVSGGDTHMSGLLSWLLDNKPSARMILVLPQGDGQHKVYPEVSRIKTITHPNALPFRRFIPLMYMGRAMQAARHVNKFTEDQDVLVASSHFLPDVLPVAVARQARQAKTVFIHHIIQDMDRPRGLHTFLANVQERLCFALIRNRFGKIVVVNQGVADRLRELGFRQQQILLSANFVKPVVQPKPYRQKDITLLFCGRMVTQKGVDDFLTVCRDLHAKVEGFNAVMIGAGPELDRLRSYVAKHHLPVKLLGYVDDATKFDLLSRARLFVFPSIEEGWGIVIAEALAVGTPVIAYHLPVYDAVFKEHVHIVPSRDVEQLTSDTHHLLTTYAQDPRRYKAEQNRIVAYADQFRVEHVARKEYSFIGN